MCSFFLPGWVIRGDGGGNRSEFRRADGSDEKDVREQAARGKWHPWTQKKTSPTYTKDKLIILYLHTCNIWGLILNEFGFSFFILFLQAECKLTLKMFTGLLQLKVLILLIFCFHSVNVSEHGMVNRTNLKDFLNSCC